MTESDDAFEDEIIEIFVEEVSDVIEIIDVNIQLCETSLLADEPIVNKTLKELRRAFHTLKGSGRMVSADAIAELGWSLENLLNRIIDGVLQADKPTIVLIKDVRNVLPALLEAFQNRQAAAVSGVNVQTYIERSNKLMAGDTDGAQDVAVEPVKATPAVEKVEATEVKEDVKVEVNPATDRNIADLRLQQKDLIESIAAMKLDLSQVMGKVDELAHDLQALSSASTAVNGLELENQSQKVEQLRSEVNDLQYFVSANSKQFTAENNAQKELTRSVNQSIEKAQAHQQEQLNHLRLEVKTWSVGAAMFCSALALGILLFVN